VTVCGVVHVFFSKAACLAVRSHQFISYAKTLFSFLFFFVVLVDFFCIGPADYESTFLTYDENKNVNHHYIMSYHRTAKRPCLL
jgi:hypothetical protein